MKSVHNVSNRAIIYIVCQLLINGFSIISSPIYTRIMSASDYGKVSIFIIISNILSIIIGMMAYGTLNNACTDFGVDNLLKYSSGIITMSFFTFFLFNVFWICFIPFITEITGLSYSIIKFIPCVAFFIFCNNFLNRYFTVSKKTYHYLWLSILNVIATFVLSILFIFLFDQPHVGRIFGISVITIVSGVISFSYFLLKGRCFLNLTYWRYCLPISFPLILHNLAGQIVSNSDRLLLNKICGSSAAGIYSLCYTVALLLETIFFGTNNAWITQFYELMDTKKYELIVKQSKRYVVFFTLVTIGFICICPELVNILAPSDYYIGKKIIPLIATGTYLLFLYTFFINCEFYYKKNHIIAIGSILSTISNILLNLWLIPKFNLMGAAIATVATYLLLFIYHYALSNGFCSVRLYKISFFLSGLFAVALTVCCVYFLFNYIIIRWCLGAVTGIVLILYLIKNKGIF